jgi:hypothetical protein
MRRGSSVLGGHFFTPPFATTKFHTAIGWSSMWVVSAHALRGLHLYFFPGGKGEYVAGLLVLVDRELETVCKQFYSDKRVRWRRFQPPETGLGMVNGNALNNATNPGYLVNSPLK